MKLLQSTAKATSFAILSFGLVTAASANITLNTTGTWYAPVTATQNGTDAFWDNVSSDNGSGKCNIGYILQGAASAPGVCNNNPVVNSAALPNKALSFLGGATANSPDAAFTFSGTGGTSTFVATITGNYGETIGYNDGTDHDLSANGGAQSQVKFSTSSSSFYFYVHSASGNYRTDTSGQQFVLFVASPSETPGAVSPSSNLNDFYLGAEDTAIKAGNAPNGDRDYNDMIIHVTATPEPALYGTIGFGLCGIVLAIKRRRKA